MKRYLPLLILLFTLMSPAYAQVADADEPSHVTITVVMPEPSAAPETEPPSFPALYPTGVHEILENGVRWIVRTYELGAGENPAHIPRGSFERGGWMYAVTDITIKETAAAEVKAHTEIITLNTETKDMETILRRLAPSMEFISEDGYTGVLTLDVSSIAVETAGTRTSGYTAGATREYPHLSGNDTSLVPKTITDGGRTLNLASVDWKTNYSSTVDYEQIPASYTAVATYTANASRTVVTGYTTTAEYKGEVSRLNQGKTIYTAYFMGTEIVPEQIPLEIAQPSPKPEATSAPDPAPELENGTEAGAEPAVGAEQPSDEKGGSLPLLLPAILPVLLIGIGGGYYVPRILKNKKSKGNKTE